MTSRQDRHKRRREQAFLDQIGRVPSGCWEWQGWLDVDGYGRTRLLGERRTHRAAYRLFCGPIPDGLCVCHHCDNPRCVRPDHLFLGTIADNNADKVRKGRQRTPLGERHGIAKLDAESVRSIRRMAADGVPVLEIARRLGRGETTVRAVLQGRTWGHVV